MQHTNVLRVIWYVTLASGMASACHAQNVSNYESIPEPLLFLLREPAVHDDLKLTDVQRAALMAFNDQLDGPLLASRNGDPEASRKQVEEALRKSRVHISESFTSAQQTRLRQIEYRVRGIDFVLLPDASQALKLSVEQKEKIQAVVSRTQEDLAKLQSPTFEGRDAFEKAQASTVELRRREQQDILALLDDAQRKPLVQLIGPKFDPATLGRVSFRAPEITGGSLWLQSKPLQLQQLRGKVVAIHFWAFGCINCIHNYPYYREWQSAYGDKGLLMVGIHTPETSAEHDLQRLREKVKEARLTHPIAADNDQTIWNAWGNSMWPSVYLVDKQGRIRYWWYGELNWNGAGGQSVMAGKIEELLAE